MFLPYDFDAKYDMAMFLCDSLSPPHRLPDNMCCIISLVGINVKAAISEHKNLLRVISSLHKFNDT